jgi:hypothetical protein
MDSLDFNILNSTLFQTNTDTDITQNTQDLFNFNFDIPYTTMPIEKGSLKICKYNKSIKKKKQEELEKLRKTLNKLQKMFFDLEGDIEKL